MPTTNIPMHVLLISNEEIENEHLRAIDRHCDNALDAIGQLCEEIAKQGVPDAKKSVKNTLNAFGVQSSLLGIEAKLVADKRVLKNVIPTRTR